MAAIPERIQAEVQRAIQRSIKGVEYIASSGPSLGSTPKDILQVRGTMNLYHYRPLADEIYRVPSLIVMATTNRGYILDMVPGQSFIDFLEMKLFQNFSDRRYFDVDRLIDSVGNVPPEMILSSFEMLRPASRVASQVQLWENIWNDEYVKSYRMFDRWATDTLPLAGEYFRGITKDLMWDNKLYLDNMSVGGHPTDLSSIKVPILHAVAEHDHIVPYDAAKPLIQKIGSVDKEEVMLKGDHVSL